MHKDEDLYKNFSLASDILLLSKIKTLRHCVVASTIPSFNMLVAKHAHQSVTAIGQEHKYYDAHSRALQHSIHQNYKKLRLLTVLTTSDKLAYERALPYLRTVVLPNGVPEKPQDKLATLKIKRAVAFARLVEMKHIDLMIDAFSLSSARDEGWVLDIFGDGDMQGALQTKIANLNASGHIRLHGATNHVDDEMAQSSMCLLTSEYESFGMVIVEAFSHRVPVVAFDVPTGPRALIHMARTACCLLFAMLTIWHGISTR
jgi:glycosyltransferase involved in cell wall biosynthesis